VAETATPGATLAAIHWRGETDYPQTGDAVHRAIGLHPAFSKHGGWLEASFRLDIFERRR
jgi:hypothetical protein